MAEFYQWLPMVKFCLPGNTPVVVMSTMLFLTRNMSSNYFLWRKLPVVKRNIELYQWSSTHIPLVINGKILIPAKISRYISYTCSKAL